MGVKPKLTPEQREKVLQRRVRDLEGEVAAVRSDLLGVTQSLGEMESRWAQLAQRQMDLEGSFMQMRPIVEVAKAQLLKQPVVSKEGLILPPGSQAADPGQKA
jgi:hypothetical protein